MLRNFTFSNDIVFDDMFLILLPICFRQNSDKSLMTTKELTNENENHNSYLILLRATLLTVKLRQCQAHEIRINAKHLK